MDDRPNVQVVFTSKPSPGPGLGAVLVEFLFFLVLVGGIALLASGGCAWFL